MSKERFWKMGVLVLAVAMLFSIGCAKKQTVQQDTSAPPVAGKDSPAAVRADEGPGAQTPAGDRTAAAEAAAGVAVTEEKASPFQDIRFDFDKSNIREDAKPILAKVADHMKKNKGARLLVEGHCDERGTAEYNMALGDRRAASAKKYLESLGVSSDSVSTISFGKEKPADPGHDEAAWAKNRRAHFVLK